MVVSRVRSDGLSDDDDDDEDVPHRVPGGGGGKASRKPSAKGEDQYAVPVEAATLRVWDGTPVSAAAGGWRIPFAFTLAGGAGLLICIVGFLAWAVPFTNLTATIDPLVLAIRSLCLNEVASGLQTQWAQIRQQAIIQRNLWNTFGQPGPPLANAVYLGRLFQPLVQSNPILVSAPYITMNGPCIEAAILVSEPVWQMNLQNCTHRWNEEWDPIAQNLTGRVLGYNPLLTLQSAVLTAPMDLATPAQPFVWLKVFNAHSTLGNIFSGSVGLFNETTGAFIGRFAVSITTSNLKTYLQQQLASQPQLANGRLALFDPDTNVVAATAGRVSLSTMYNLSSIGDPDLEAAAAVLAALPGGQWCTNRSLEVDFSVPFFLDTMLAADPYPSPYKLEWCVLLLTPRSNTLAAVDRSMTFALVFVCCMTLSVTLVAVLLGVLVTQPLQRLTGGMCALTAGDTFRARASAADRSRFTELHRAQRSYQSLVDAMEAFGKYVPLTVVQGLLGGTILPQLGMEERSLAVGFMDVEDFTALCETTKVTEMVAATSRLFDMCCDRIAESKGTIDKFIGDCIMAFWGAPVALPKAAVRAAEAVLEILTSLEATPVVVRKRHRLQLRVGLHYGKCLVGNFGASGRWDYTVMGDVVNTASRLEGLNKQFRTRCLITGAIREQTTAAEHLACRIRSMGDVVLLGKKVPVPVYELLVAPVEDPRGWAEAVRAFSVGQARSAAAYLGALTGDLAAEQLTCDIIATAPGGPFVRQMRTK